MVETSKRDATTYRLKFEQLMVSSMQCLWGVQSELTSETSKREKLQTSTQQLEKLVHDQKESSQQIKQQNDTLAKRAEALQNEVMLEIQRRQDSNDQLESLKRDCDQRIQDMDVRLGEMAEKLEQQATANDEKDLEISRLRRESEETNKKNKSHNEKIVSYQATNERLRKDKAALEERLTEMQKQMDI